MAKYVLIKYRGKCQPDKFTRTIIIFVIIIGYGKRINKIEWSPQLRFGGQDKLIKLRNITNIN